jgi:TetR/AcrR family transcriptional regulator, regulator of cefoperazone and chloramphenicol sensitivity
MNETSNLSPRERILEAVVTVIEKDGFDSLTTRKIAEQAGVNIASINYYFRSKDLLVEEALAMTLRNMMEDIDSLVADAGKPFLETMEEALYYLIEGGLHFPRTILAHIYHVLVDKRYDTPSARSLQGLFELLADRASLAYPDISPGTIRYNLVQIGSSVFFTMLAPGFLQPVAQVDFSEPGELHRLARYLTHLFAAGIEM